MQAPEIPLPEMSIMNKPVNPEMTMDMTGAKSILTTPGSVMTPGAGETPSMINAQMSTPKEQEEITAIKKKKKSKLLIDNELYGGKKRDRSGVLNGFKITPDAMILLHL